MESPTVSQFLTVMRSYIGVIESPLGSNLTSVGLAFGWNGVPWCAQTVSLAAQKSGFERKFWSSSTDQWENSARLNINGAKWIFENATPRPGDLPVWDYKGDGTANHISVLESLRTDGMLITIGGNENDRCQRAVRSKRALRGYVRLPFRVLSVFNPVPVLNLPKDDDMAIAVKGNQSPKVYATNWIHKNHIPNQSQLAQMYMSGLKSNNGVPFVVEQETIDGIPNI